MGLVSQPKRDRLGHLTSFRPYTRVVCGVGLVSPPTLPGLEKLDLVE
jgi:hypothetical protein